MTTGEELLGDARKLSDDDIDRAFGFCAAKSRADSVDRPALVACLTTEFSAADRALVQRLTRQEITWVEATGGCGDALLACCWMLFMIGQLEDSTLIWHAKMINFDTSCYIDSVFLVAAGLPETVDFARSRGLEDMAQWIESLRTDKVPAVIEGWRHQGYFTDRPPLGCDVVDLAQWIRGEA